MASLSGTANGEEENAGEEKYAQSRIQRTIRILHPNGKTQGLHPRDYCYG